MERRKFVKYLGLGSIVGILPASIQNALANANIFGSNADKSSVELPSVTPVDTGKFNISNGIIGTATINPFRLLDSQVLNQRIKHYVDHPELVTKDSRYKFPFVTKTPIVNCADDEIIGKYDGRMYTADIIADDQQAIIFKGNSMFTTTSIPNIKMGARIGEGAMLRILDAKHGRLTENSKQFLNSYFEGKAKDIAHGLLQRINCLLCAMYCDSALFDRVGFKIQGGWGTPDDLKAIADTNNVATQLKGLLANAKDAYGEKYDHMMLSNQAFETLTNSKDFGDNYGGVLRTKVGLDDKEHPAFIIPDRLMRKVKKLFKLKEVQIFDGTYWEKSASGHSSRVRVLPAGTILLSCIEDQNNGNAADFANGVVLESIFGGILGNGTFSDVEFGAVGYYTGNVDMNPPEFVAWGVMRGFPRKHRVTMSATLVIVGMSYDEIDLDTGETLKS